MAVDAGGRIVLVVLFPVFAVAVGVWVYLDSRRQGREGLAPWLGLVVGGLLVAGSVPGLVALAMSADAVTQGFPTAIRIVPGLVALAGYLYFR